MKAKAYVLFVVGAILLSMLVGWNAFGQKQSSSRTAWEYKVVEVAYYNEESQRSDWLNQLGGQGWELVAVRDGHHSTTNPGNSSTNYPVLYFKRAK